MTYLIMQILICLLIAFILGFLFGWWLRGKRCEQDVIALNRELREARSRGPDIEVDSERLSRLERELDETRRREAERIAEIQRLQSRLDQGPSTSPAAIMVNGSGFEGGVQPPLLEAPDGNPDDLKRISGIGPKLEQTLNRLGVWHFHQIASLTPENIIWVNQRLKFKGRIQREQWLQQARILATGGEAGLSGSNKPEE